MREAGFTLIEVLVALVVAAILSSILLSGSSLAKRREMAALEKRKAVFLARTVLVDADGPGSEAAGSSGTVNGFSWHVTEQRVMTDPRGRVALVELAVRVENKAGRTLFSATTRRLKPAAGL